MLRPSHLAQGLRVIPRSLLALAVLGLCATAERAWHHRESPGVTPGLTPGLTPGGVPSSASALGALPLGGLCRATGAFCVNDATCGPAGRCEDPAGLTGRLRAMAPATGDSTPALSPELVWNGDGYGCVWLAAGDDRLDLWFARLSPTGQRVGRPVRLTSSDTVKVLPSLVWDGGGYAVAYTEVAERSVSANLLRFGPDGALRGPARRVAPEEGIDLAARLVWNGREYAAAWYHVDRATQMSVRFARIAPDGARPSPTRVLHQRFMAGGPASLAWTGDAYGVGFTSYVPRDERSSTLFVRVGAGGEGAAAVPVASGPNRNGGTSLAWNGRHFGVAWEDDVQVPDDAAPTSALAYAGVGPSGVVVPRRTITGRDGLVLRPSLAWSGVAYGLAWTRVSEGSVDVYFARVTDGGAVDGTALRVTTRAPGALPSLVWTGREYGLAWTDGRDGDLDIYFTRLSASGSRVGQDVRVTAP